MFDFVQSKLLGCGNKLQINFQLPTLLKKKRGLSNKLKTISTSELSLPKSLGIFRIMLNF